MRADRAEAAEQERGGQELPAVRLTALVAADSATMRRVLAGQLVRAGCQVLEAEDGAAALARAARCHPALVFLEARLPDQDGIATCRALRALEEAGDPYVVLLLAATEEARLFEAFAAGADDYLTVPLRARDLPAALARAWRALARAPDGTRRDDRPAARRAKGGVTAGE